MDHSRDNGGFLVVVSAVTGIRQRQVISEKKEAHVRVIPKGKSAG
jgi:hypothetical protein